MVQIIQKILNKLFGLVNLQIIKKNENGIIDKRSVASFQKKDENYKLYFEGLNKSKNNNSDNFWNLYSHKNMRPIIMKHYFQMILLS